MQDMAISIRSQDDVAFAFYRYDPSMGGAILFTLLFIGTTFYHMFQLFRTRAWYFVPFVVGGICKCDLALTLDLHADIGSRDCRIHWTCLIQQTESELDFRALHSADALSAPRPGSPGSFNLHVPWSDYSGLASRVACNTEKEVAYQDLRCW